MAHKNVLHQSVPTINDIISPPFLKKMSSSLRLRLKRVPLFSHASQSDTSFKTQVKYGKLSVLIVGQILLFKNVKMCAT